MHVALSLERAALFLDLDGTLVDLAPTPEAARPDPACLALIGALGAKLHGRLALLTGRSIAVADRMVRRSVICVAGVHGLERRTAAGELESAAAHPGLVDAGDVLEALARARTGLQLERKGASVALHYRQAPDTQEAVMETVERLARATGLEVQHGKAVAELRTPGPSKAAALKSFMREAPFAGALPLVLGDDLTDEPAFQAAAHLGGWGVLVGAPRESGAHFRLPSPRAARAWLAQGVERGAFDLGAASWVG